MKIHPSKILSVYFMGKGLEFNSLGKFKKSGQFLFIEGFEV
jgi:hypothetical protein